MPMSQTLKWQMKLPFSFGFKVDTNGLGLRSPDSGAGFALTRKWPSPCPQIARDWWRGFLSPQLQPQFKLCTSTVLPDWSVSIQVTASYQVTLLLWHSDLVQKVLPACHWQEYVWVVFIVTEINRFYTDLFTGSYCPIRLLVVKTRTLKCLVFLSLLL